MKATVDWYFPKKGGYYSRVYVIVDIIITYRDTDSILIRIFSRELCFHLCTFSAFFLFIICILHAARLFTAGKVIRLIRNVCL